MKAILHIGREKTGTTSLQGFLSENREGLLAQGFHYSQALGDENHIALTAYASADDVRDSIRKWLGISTAEDLATFREMLRASLDKEVSLSPGRAMIFSNEHCSARLQTREEKARLKSLLDGLFDEIEVVVYLRRQDELLLSMYSTGVKSGRVEPLSPGGAGAVARRFDHLRLLEDWSAVFGKVTARLHSGDVVGDFCAALGLDLSVLRRPARDRNGSLDAPRLEFLRLLNQHLPALADAGGDPLRSELVALLEEASTGPRPTTSARFLDRVMDASRESNAAVADRWFDGRHAPSGDPLFGERREGAETLPVNTITPEQAAETAAAMWLRCQEEIQQLRAENQRLEQEVLRLGEPRTA